MRAAWPCRQSPRSAGSSGKLAANDKKIKKDVEQKVLDGLGMTDAGQDADFVASSLTGSFGQFSQSRCTPWAQISTRPFCMISLGPSTRCHMPLPSACPPAPLPRGLMWSICGCGLDMMFGQPGPTRMFVPEEAPVLPSPSPLPLPWSSEPPLRSTRYAAQWASSRICLRWW